MCLEYGNYFFQKLIKKLNIQQKLAIYQIIEPEFLVIATNKCGTHSIQSLMDIIETPFENLALNRLISKNMLLLFTDDNAYHIMMKMILDFPEEKRNILNLLKISITYTEGYRSGDVCERRRGRMQRAKRSGSGRKIQATLSEEFFAHRNRT